jgi:hypothetical protein
MHGSLSFSSFCQLNRFRFTAVTARIALRRLIGCRRKKNHLHFFSLRVKLPVQRSDRFRRGSRLLSDPRANRNVSDLYAARTERCVKGVGIGAQRSTSYSEVREYFKYVVGHVRIDRRSPRGEEDCAAAASPHVGQYRLDSRKGAVRVEFECDLNVFMSQLRDGHTLYSRIRRRIFEHVYRAKPVLYVRKPRADRRAIEHIRPKGRRLNAFSCERADERALLGGMAGHEGNFIALRSEGPGESEPHLGTRANDGDHWHISSCLLKR